MDNKSTLSTGKYTIEISAGPSSIYRVDEDGNKVWIGSATDPQLAMDIIEGLILVEHKRFYHPEAGPVISAGNTKISPPFIKSV